MIYNTHIYIYCYMFYIKISYLLLDHFDLYSIPFKIELLGWPKLVWFSHSHHKTGTSTSVGIDHHETAAVYVVLFAVLWWKTVFLFMILCIHCDYADDQRRAAMTAVQLQNAQPIPGGSDNDRQLSLRVRKRFFLRWNRVYNIINIVKCLFLLL